MTLQIESLDRPQPADVARLIEDFASTLPLYADAARRDRPLAPSNAILQVLGEAFLDAAALGTPAAMRSYGGFDKLVDSWLVPTMAGTVQLSYVLQAAVLGRASLRDLFCVDGRYDLDACLRWLVLHGIRELRLQPFLSRQFVAALRAPTLLVRGQRISPLQSCIMAERPDTLEAFQASAPGPFQSFFARWFLDHAVGDYAHTWLMTDAQLRQSLQEQPSGERLGLPMGHTPPDGLGFPDSNPDPKTPQTPSRTPARADFRSFGADYPCAYLDLTDQAAVERTTMSGQVRPGVQGGVELLSPVTALRLPSAANGAMLAHLELQVPNAEGLWVRLRGWDHPWSNQFEHVLPATVLNAGMVTLPFTDHGPTPRLDIAFARPGATAPARPDYLPTYAVLRSLRVWHSVG